MPPSDWAPHRPDAALPAPWRHRFLSRLLFRPSRHRMDCAKRALNMPCPWGKVQIWREAIGSGCNDMEQKCRPVAVLRFLGARGRAEQGTTDPLNRLPHVPGEVWIVNPPGFGGSLGPVSLLRHAQAALLAFDEMVRHCPHARHWVYGHSLGALFALHVAARREVHGLILKNALPVFPLLQSRLGRKAARWLIQGMPPGLDALRNARHSPRPPFSRFRCKTPWPRRPCSKTLWQLMLARCAPPSFMAGMTFTNTAAKTKSPIARPFNGCMA